MRKLSTVVVVLFFVVAAVVMGINVCLVDDDLRDCGSKPTDGSKDGNGKKCYRADAVVAVSGGDTTARARKAIELYKLGWANKLIFSGASADPKAISNAEAMKRVAVKAGISEADIIMESKSKNTTENANKTEQILTKNNIKRVILVTSPYHLRRVKMNFQRQGKNIDFRTAAASDSAWSGWWFLTARGWWLALTEIGGIVKLMIGG